MNDATQRGARLQAVLQQRLKKAASHTRALPIPRRAGNAAIPLSFAQQRLWFMDHLQPGNPAYNRPTHVHLHGPLDKAVLGNSLNEVVRRHEILRASFSAIDGKPLQTVAPSLTVGLPVIDLGKLPAYEQQAEISRIATEETQQSFDLSRLPLLKAKLARLGDSDHLLFLTLHHIVFDGWSAGILIRELATHYEALSAGDPSSLSQLPIQYTDFACWQQQTMQGALLESQLAFWKTRLGGELPVLELPTDRPRPSTRTFRGARHRLVLPSNLAASLKSLSQREGATLFMTLLAAFQVLLHRYTAGNDIVVGVPIAGRNRLETENLIGAFINTLVLRSDLSGNPGFRELIGRVRTTALEAYAHQELPFEKLVEELRPARDLNHTPIFQVLFQLRNLPNESVETNAGLRITEADFDSGLVQFDLALDIVDRPEALSCVADYSTDLFDEATIARLLEHYETLLRGVVDNPNATLSQLPLLTEAERKQLLIDWNDTAADYPNNRCIHQLFEAQVARTAEAVAVVFEHEQLSYAQLNARANQLARHMISLGVGPEVLVAVCVERSIEMVVALLGILKAGGAYLPLDPAYPKERLAFMLEDSKAAVLVTQSKLEVEVTEHVARCVLVDRLEAFDRYPITNPGTGVTPDNLAYVIYTSGSTGQPKGAMNTHRGIVNRLLWMQDAYRLDSADRVLQKTPFSFDVSVWEFFWPLLSGACLVVARPGGHQDSAYLVKTVIAGEISTLHFVPSMLHAFLAEHGVENCRCLKRVICSGEALPFDLQQRFFERLPAVELHNLYGPTEAAVDVTFWACDPASTYLVVPIGRPIANTQIYILDPNLNPVPIGVPGELHIGGVGLARGYLNRPELTKEKFIPNPFSKEPGCRLYKTGDLARYLPDGNIEFLGRIDTQVKIRGFRIELGEIEAVLNQHAEVQACAVIAREDTPGDKRLVAYLVAAEESAPSDANLRDHLKQSLPDYMLPSAFVVLDELPLTPNGKLDRKALPAPDNVRAQRAESFMPPRTSIEQQLADIFAGVLKIDRVGIGDNFFELGGHSLQATQVISRVRAVFNIDLALRSLFEAPTIGELAESIEQRPEGNAKPHTLEKEPIERASKRAIPRRASSDRMFLSLAQEQLWFAEQLEPGTSAYNIIRAMRLVGALNVAALECSLDEIVRRHEVLRTTFVEEDGRPVVSVAPPAPLMLPVADISDTPESRRDEEIRRFAMDELGQPFALAQGSLFRARLLRLTGEEYVLFLTTHHIVDDGWSRGVLSRELGMLYPAFMDGRPSPLPELPIQYADFATWQREQFHAGAYENALTYWKQRLAGAAVLRLPTDRPRPAVQSFRGATHRALLPDTLAAGLKSLGQREGATLFMTLLAAFQMLLARYSGQEDIVVGTDVANRYPVETEALIGFFISHVILRTDLSGNPTFRELLDRVREVALSAYDYQDVPFGKLVEALRPERSLSYSPLFQVLLVLQNFWSEAPRLPRVKTDWVALEVETSKFDLLLSIEETDRGLAAKWVYKTELFDAATIARMAAQFENLLSAVVARPDTRLSEFAFDTERKQQTMEADERKRSMLASMKPKAIRLNSSQVVKTGHLPACESLPLVLEPQAEAVELIEWASGQRGYIENELRKHGALLFRGFDVKTPAEFERFASSLCPDLFGEYGDLPREEIGGKVYGSTPYPPDQSILFHNESSHMHRWPMKIWFYCVTAAKQGGETPIVDCRRLYERIDPAIRRKLTDRKLMYVRNYIDGLDVSWQSFFGTQKKSEVESYCRGVRTDCEWKDDGGLRTRQICPATAKHPQTGEMVFFNQLQLHHPACLPSALRDSLLGMLRPEDLPRNVLYGDGSPIEDSVMAEISEAYAQTSVSFPWREGDILMLNNMLVAHARNPYTGPRKIVVAMAEMVSQHEVAPIEGLRV